MRDYSPFHMIKDVLDPIKRAAKIHSSINRKVFTYLFQMSHWHHLDALASYVFLGLFPRRLQKTTLKASTLRSTADRQRASFDIDQAESFPP